MNLAVDQPAASAGSFLIGPVTERHRIACDGNLPLNPGIHFVFMLVSYRDAHMINFAANGHAGDIRGHVMNAIKGTAVGFYRSIKVADVRCGRPGTKPPKLSNRKCLARIKHTAQTAGVKRKETAVIHPGNEGGGDCEYRCNTFLADGADGGRGKQCIGLRYEDYGCLGGKPVVEIADRQVEGQRRMV